MGPKKGIRAMMASIAVPASSEVKPNKILGLQDTALLIWGDVLLNYMSPEARLLKAAFRLFTASGG